MAEFTKYRHLELLAEGTLNWEAVVNGNFDRLEVETFRLPAGEALAAYDVVGVTSYSSGALTDSKVYKVCSTDPYRAAGLARTSVSSGSQVDVIYFGVVQNFSWNWQPDKFVYLSSSKGQLTQTSGTQVIGLALTTNTVLVSTFGSSGEPTTETEGKNDYICPFVLAFPEGTTENYSYQIQICSNELFSDTDIICESNSATSPRPDTEEWKYFGGNSFQDIPSEGLSHIYDGYRGYFKKKGTSYKGALFYRVRAHGIESESDGPWWGDVTLPISDQI